MMAAAPERAAAEGPVRLSLEVAPCADLEARRVEELVRLSATVVPSADETAVAVEVTCEGETLAITARRRSPGARPLRRLVRLQEVGEASRARLVSLAVTELATALDHASTARGPASAKRAPVASQHPVAAPVAAAPAVVATEDEPSATHSAEPGAAPDSSPAPPPAAATPTPPRPNHAAASQRNAPPPSPPAVAVVARAAAPSGGHTVQLVLLARGGAEHFPRAFGTAASGGLRLSLDGARRLGLTFDLQGSTADVPVSAGSVTVSTLALVPSLHARIESEGGRWGVRAGAGPKLGFGIFGGNPSAPPSEATRATYSAPWIGISSFAALRARPAGPIVIEISGEGGVVLSPLAGLVDGRREVAISGPWLAIFAAAGVLL
jgi:hypothetical protein